MVQTFSQTLTQNLNIMNREAQKEQLKSAYHAGVMTIEELSKWLDYLDGNPVVQSSTTEQEFVDFIAALADRLAKKNRKSDQKDADKAVKQLLKDSNISTN